MKHFFADGHVNYGDGRLDINTEGGIVTVNPSLKNGVDLLSMEITNTVSGIETVSRMDNSGILHNKSVCCKWGGSYYIEYRLDKNYHWFKCNAFVTKEATDFSYNSDIWDKASITVTADNGTYLWGTDAISRDSGQQTSDVIDITGVKYIRITFYNAGGSPKATYTPYLALGEPRLYEDY